LRRTLQRIVFILVLGGAILYGGVALAQQGGGAGAGTGTGAGAGGAGAADAAENARTCTLYGCAPTLGNPIQELGGMIVTCGAIAVLLGGAARRVVG
jgi:hypothetical protein